MTSFFAGQKLRAAELEALLGKDSPLPLGVRSRGRRETNSTTTTTEVGVLRLDDVPVYVGRAYRIWTTPILLDTSVANDVVRAVLRYTTDGATPGTSSTQMIYTQSLQDDASQPSTVQISVVYTPIADELLSLLLTINRASGTGTVGIVAAATYPLDLVVEDIGLDPGDTGSDI